MTMHALPLPCTAALQGAQHVQLSFDAVRSPPEDATVIDLLNGSLRRRAAVMLGAYVSKAMRGTRPEDLVFHVDFELLEAFAHSAVPGRVKETGIVQGGYVTACMLEALHLAIAFNTSLEVSNASVMECRTTYATPTRIGTATCHVTILRLGRRVAFMSSALLQAGTKTALMEATLHLRGKDGEDAALLEAARPHVLPPWLPRDSLEAQAMRSLFERFGMMPFQKVWQFRPISVDMNKHVAWMEYNMPHSMTEGLSEVTQDSAPDPCVQAGFVVGIADSALCAAHRAIVNHKASPGQLGGCPTIELRVTFLAPVFPCIPVTVEATLTQMTHSFAYIEGSLLQNNQMVARAFTRVANVWVTPPNGGAKL